MENETRQTPTWLSPYYQDDYVTIYQGDCGKIMPYLGEFDLLLCDPPYGIGEGNQKRILSREKIAAPKDYGDENWDSKPVEKWVMELARSRAGKQIIFGGNYYKLPETKCWLLWDKENSGDFADAEIAWTNLDQAVRLKKHLWNGMIRKGCESRYHPTQKPLAVMAWALQQAGEVKTCLDPWMGSGTTLRACKDAGVKCVGIELQEKYCEIAAQRMLQEVLPFNQPMKGHHGPIQDDFFQVEKQD